MVISMFGIEFGTAADYHELNAGAHRKPPKVLSAPSLVWHLACWTNFQERDGDGKPQYNEDGSPRKKTPQQIKNAVDNYIITLRDAIAANAHVGKDLEFGASANEAIVDLDGEGSAAKVRLAPCISGVCLLFGNAYDEKSLAPVPTLSLGRRQNDIFEGTNRTVTLRFVWKKLDVTIRFEVHTEYFSMSTFVELDKDRVKALSRTSLSSIPALNKCTVSILKYLNDAGSADEEELVVRINKYCFHEFWKTYQQDILSDKSVTDCTGDPIFRHIFADFRGFVASDQAVKFPDEDFFRTNQPAKWGMAAKKKFLPLIQHRNRTERSRYECAVNYMLDGRALYMSTLGPQLPTMAEDERIPVEFIVYAHQRFNDTTIVNKWQLGRLVSQILLLGTLRLSALKDVKSLHDAGRQLGLLEESTQKAREAIALTEADPSASRADGVLDGSRRQARSAAAMRRIADAHRKLNDITGTFLRETGEGLLYRIERSRYYVQQFDENVKLLRIKRLEGDQPYDQFIRRRLGSEFDFINRLGTRYERATATIVTLDQNYLAISQNALVERANKIDEETNSIQADIHTIQEWGEFALLAALVPYYVMHLLDLIITEKYVPVLAASIWTVFGGLALYRKFKNWGYVAAFLVVAIPAIVVVAWPLLFGTVAGGGILRAYETAGRELHAQQEIDQIQKSLEKLADQQLAILRDLASSRSKPDEQKQDRPAAESQKSGQKP